MAKKGCKAIKYATLQRATRAIARLNTVRKPGARPYFGANHCEKCNGFHLSTNPFTQVRCNSQKYDDRASAVADIASRNQKLAPARRPFSNAYLCPRCDFYHLC